VQVIAIPFDQSEKLVTIGFFEQPKCSGKIIWEEDFRDGVSRCFRFKVEEKISICK